MPHPPPLPYHPHPDDTFGETRELSDVFPAAIQPFYSGQYNNLEPLRYDESPHESLLETDPVPIVQSAPHVFQDAVDAARRSMEQSLAGGEKIGGAVNLKLTIDLSDRGLMKVPEEVVDIIKREVERLKLFRNRIFHLPLRFEECRMLKYLNLKENNFKEIPYAVFKLPLLEIFDMSCNKLECIPDEIREMRALRVLSVMRNQIRNVSANVAMMDNVKILKLDHNPLNPDLKRIVDQGANSPSEAKGIDTTSREIDTTEKVKRSLRTMGGPIQSSEEDSSSDGPLDTPRAPTRNLSSRFPVKPSMSGSESLSDINTRSPGFAKPPIPARSHYRIPSGQNELLHSGQTPALRRPGLAPLSNGSERNRSNSESILQATQNNRTKRMGFITKKQSGLGKVEEMQPNRNSFHSRGQSHGSALHDRGNAGLQNGENDLSISLSTIRQQGTFIRRLSSLPEHKQESIAPSLMLEGAKSLLFSLHQVHPNTSSLIRVIRNRTIKRKTRLEKVHVCVTNQLEALDNAIHGLEAQTQPPKSKALLKNQVTTASEAAVLGYQQATEHLMRRLARLVVGGDQRYIRTLMLLLYGSIVEERNACWSVFPITTGNDQVKAINHPISIISDTRLKRDDRSVTPTRDRPNPQRRWRNGPAVQQVGYFSPVPSGAQTAVPLYVNGRSRSNSRTGHFINSNASSIANTPRSGESFMVPGTPQIRSRSNSALGGYFNPTHNLLHPPEHDAIFEKIYNCLTRTVELGQKDIPGVLLQASKCLDVAQTSERNKPFVNLWSTLILRSRQCLDMCEILKMRLKSIKLNDVEVRYAKDFWRLCTKLFDSVTKLLDGIKEARRLELISKDMVYAIQPILRTVKEATHLVYNSPWSQLLEAETPERATTAQSVNGMHHDHRYRSRTGSGNSPYLNNIPATPLSAALGPAAQATVPTSASLDRSFAGDVFQRAEELLRVQQTIIPRR